MKGEIVLSFNYEGWSNVHDKKFSWSRKDCRRPCQGEKQVGGFSQNWSGAPGTKIQWKKLPKNSKNRFTTNIVDASSDIFWKGFLWLLVVAQSILEDELYDALADLGSFQNIGESESTVWFAKIPNPCNAIPFLWKAKRSPTPEGEKVLSNYLRWKIWKWKSDLISNCNPSPCDFQKRTRLPFPKNPPIDRQDFWRYRKLVWQWKFHQGQF